MRQRKDFSFDERTIKYLNELAHEDCTTMSATLEKLILKEYRRRSRKQYEFQYTAPESPKYELTPEIVADLIINKLAEKRNGGDMPQDFKIIEIRKGDKEKRWSHCPLMDNYRILIDSVFKGPQSFVYYIDDHIVCRITKSNHRQRFLSLR